MGSKRTRKRAAQRRLKRERVSAATETLVWFPPPGYVAPGVQAQQATDLEWQLRLLEERDDVEKP